MASIRTVHYSKSETSIHVTENEMMIYDMIGRRLLFICYLLSFNL